VGRVTQFIYYLNEEYEPTPLVKMAEYSHISFTDEINEKGRAYRNQRRREQKVYTEDDNG